MAKAQKVQKQTSSRHPKLIRLTILVLLLVSLIGLSNQISTLPIPAQQYEQKIGAGRDDLRREVLARTRRMESTSHELSVTLSPEQGEQFEQQLVVIKQATNAGNYDMARMLLIVLSANLSSVRSTLAIHPRAKLSTPAGTPTRTEEQIPILLYHKPPGDFENQLQALHAKGYTAITMAMLNAHLRSGAQLPAKSVVITFDDGFSDQLPVIGLLQKYNMRATFYLILGHDQPGFCLGINADRDPTTAHCADSYMSWAEVKTLDASGIAEIGAHTMDHFNLTSLSEADQREQIVESKLELERGLGHSVTTFAYPYGSYNAVSIAIVQAAGFSTAVTTRAGMNPTLGTIYTLPRMRSAYELP